jgi:hypothetical protein
MRRALLFGLLQACQCDPGGVTSLEARLDVTPLALDLGEVPVGVRVQGAFTLSSTGEALVEIGRIELEEVAPLGGFAIINDPARRLNPTESDVLLVEARPAELGEHTAIVAIDSDAQRSPNIRIPIRVRGVPAPPCDDGNACTTDTFDVGLNDCSHTFADGAPCQPADKCVLDASCFQGVCLGGPKACDDQSMCTRDFCRQTDGHCVFIQDESLCDDDNPCTEDRCAAASCEHVALPSGSPCDDGDLCTTLDSCFSGRCVGNGQPDGSPCDDGDSCTVADTCSGGVCGGTSIVAPAAEGSVLFEVPLTDWPDRAFLHRREVSMGDDGTFFGLDHLNLSDPAPGLTHIIFAFEQCGSPVYEFTYRPPDSHVLVRFVRREMQLDPNNNIRVVVGIRQLSENGDCPQNTTYQLDDQGRVRGSEIQVIGGETGRSLLPDGSHIFGVVWPLDHDPGTGLCTLPGAIPLQNLVVVREDVSGNVLWRHERAADDWAEFLGVAGPRVLFWARGRFGALDFNTGDTVWTQETQVVADEMALHTGLNLGVIRTSLQLHGFEILNGTHVFSYPAAEDATYVPRTDPVISADGRILVMMMAWPAESTTPERLDWVELTSAGDHVRTVTLPYVFPADFAETRHEDRDDPYPTVADDGVTYVGYGDAFWAINPDGSIRWTYTSTVENAFTGTVPLLRDDGVLFINEKSRKVIGIRTNGGLMSQSGWASFRHDNRRTRFTP